MGEACLKGIKNELEKEIPIPCPICGKRLLDFKGHSCPGNFEIEVKCLHTKSCGYVRITAQYIEKKLAIYLQER